MKEQRQYYRLETDITAKIKKEGDTDFTPAKIVNISLIGVYLRLKEPLKAGKQIELSFQLPRASKSPIICQAKVKWTAEFKGHHSGVEFIDIKRPDRYKIAGFIKGALRTMIYKKKGFPKLKSAKI
ncbi:MAG: PilZ domain-containing protein [Candidatus Omnitrophica bacterium]|nr:PilZ domain-containing protein [Candidatus Omnitrophota bacterium]